MPLENKITTGNTQGHQMSKDAPKPIIQGLWIGDRLSPMEQLSINSFLFHQHDYHLYAYHELSGVPDGVELRDANEIIDSKDIFTTHGGSYAHFADWFRWKLLRDRGNYWCDLDVICLKHFDFTDELVYGYERYGQIAIGVLKFPSNHKIPTFLEKICENPFGRTPWDGRRKILKKRFLQIFGRTRYYNSVWGVVGGPKGFTNILKNYNLEKYAKPFTYFYPISYLHWYAIFDETFENDENLFSNTYTIHLWNEVIRREPGFDKNAKFSDKSLIEKLRKKYMPS